MNKVSPTASIILSEGVADDFFLGTLLKKEGLYDFFEIKPPQGKGFPDFEIDCPHCQKKFKKRKESGGMGSFKERLEGLKSDNTINDIRKRKSIVIIADSDNSRDKRFGE